jgi:hypothetical protein
MAQAKLKNIAINTGLAFLAGFVTTFGVFLAATDKAPDTVVVKAAIGAAIYAGARAAYGVVSAAVTAIPQVPTDK